MNSSPSAESNNGRPVNLPLTSIGTSSSEAVRTGWSDWLGMVASIACAIHCAVMPFVIASLPALGLSFLADEAFHKWMALICFGIALAAFIPGWRKHRRLLPAAIGMIGLTLISGAAFGLAGECCPSCAEVAANVQPADASTVDPICTEECCELCAAEAASEMDASDEPDSGTAQHASLSPLSAISFLSPIAPWLTPIGGLILVAAHLLNRRFGCLCGCCESNPAT